VTITSTSTHNLFMATVSASVCDLSCFDLSSSSISDYTRNDNELANQMTLQISKHFRVFLSMDLNLELR